MIWLLRLRLRHPVELEFLVVSGVEMGLFQVMD